MAAGHYKLSRESYHVTGEARYAAWRLPAALPLLVLALASPPAAAAEPVLHHELQVTLQPADHRLTVDDTVTLPAGAGPRVRLMLHRGMAPRVTAGTLQAVAVSAADMPADLQAYDLTLPAGRRRVTFHYGGTIFHPLTQQSGEERRMRTTSGIIADEGVYLDSASGWFPVVDGARVTFTLTAHMPAGWDAVSQGKEAGGAHGAMVWRCRHPQDDIFLVGARFTRYQRDGDGVSLQAYLRSPDPALAERYLKAAGEYIHRYSGLLGPYPYGKFALVENFWESGYGMPSFTLLGSEILRFPFIIYTSFPHEILHDWWGNGVFVDYRSGNWSEGVTAYLSDHLERAQQGKGAEYRRETLQKYADFVSGSRDFPLSDFTARNSEATEAIGYGKSMMLFHMLNLRTGDDDFVKALRRFYHDYKFRTASFDDIRGEFERVTGLALGPFFHQWVDRTGAPALGVARARAVSGNGHALALTLTQSQPGPAYRLQVPVAVTLRGHDRAFETRVAMTAKRVTVKLPLPAAPLRVDVDPRFDIFRRLSPQEVPPALSGLFGADSLLIVLPSAAPAPLLHAYRELASAWAASPAFNVTVTSDSELKALPADRAVWLFGWSNRFRDRVEAALRPYPGVTVGDGTVAVDGHAFPAAGKTLVAAAQIKSGAAPIGWLATDQPAAVTGLGRKLPHYSKYGYLIFQGRAPDNIDRGVWPVMDSPMTVMLAKGVAPVPMAALPPRPPLMILIPKDLLLHGGHGP